LNKWRAAPVALSNALLVNGGFIKFVNSLACFQAAQIISIHVKIGQAFPMQINPPALLSVLQLRGQILAFNCFVKFYAFVEMGCFFN